MSQEWMIDVLTDIRQFARQNRFPGLTDILDDAIIVAASELRERGEICSMAGKHGNETGDLRRGIEEHSITR